MKGVRLLSWLMLTCSLAIFARSAPVSNCDEASLRTAMALGGMVTFECDGTIVLSNTLVVASSVTLDATGRSVVLDGNGSVRIFDVLGGATLHLINLTLANGLAMGTNGPPGQGGGRGQGGAIRISSATLTALNCKFFSNRALGGTGGQGNPLGPPMGYGGVGEGGAIFLAPGQVRLTNCIFGSNIAAGGKGGTNTNEMPGFPTAAAPGGPAYGGAICAGNSQISLVGCEFGTNRANAGAFGNGLPFPDAIPGTWGGACYVASGTVSAQNCAWIANVARLAGGAFYNDNALGSSSFDHCQFRGNGVDSGNPSQGGAIFSAALFEASYSLFENNSAGGRGGLIFRSGTYDGGAAEGGALWLEDARINNCAFIGNRAQGGNGQISIAPGPARAGSAYGGAVFSHSAIRVRNSTFGFNSAVAGNAAFSDGSKAQGGAIAHSPYIGGALRQLDLAFCTIASNLVSDTQTNNLTGGGGYHASADGAVLRAVILSGNLALAAPHNAEGFFMDSGYNLSSDGTPTFTQSTSFNNTDSKLGGLVNAGGPTPVFPLLMGSPSINAVPTAFSLAIDQRGVFRPQGPRADIGAFEQTFLQIHRLPPSSQRIQIRYDGVPGERYTLSSTTDFKDWTDVQSQTADASGGVFFSNLDSSTGLRFFRAHYP